MADVDKVIKALKICFLQKDCEGCPYQKELKAILDKRHNDDWHCPVLDDDIALLKEQEAVEPEKASSSSGITWWNVCGVCKTAINPNDKYCHECGRAVKWE